MLELEKIAFNKGYTFAVAFVNDACRLCENAMWKTEYVSTQMWRESQNMELGSIQVKLNTYSIQKLSSDFTVNLRKYY